jgi:hypothetical protein
LFGSRRKQDIRDNQKLIERLDGRAVKYVARREPDSTIESVIGRAGRINTKNGFITIICNGTEVFRCPVNGAKCGELLSLEGVRIHGQDIKTGEQTQIIAYYKYYR